MVRIRYGHGRPLLVHQTSGASGGRKNNSVLELYNDGMTMLRAPDLSDPPLPLSTDMGAIALITIDC